MSFTIKELEALSGIKAHTIRIWEQRYNFLKPSRTNTNIRTYSGEELKTILTVALLNKHGYKISRINNMAPVQRRQEIIAISATEAITEHLVNDLISSMIDLDGAGFETILNNHIAQHDIFFTLQTLVFPFLEKTGTLWQTSRINPAHEHLATAIIRQKIISAIDQLPLSATDKPLFLLLLPEDEHHELGILLAYYLLKKQGLPVLYLGASVPLKDVTYVVNIKKPAYLYLHLTSFPSRQNLQKYLTTLSTTTQTPVIISGAAIHGFKKELPAGIQAITSFEGLYSFLHSL